MTNIVAAIVSVFGLFIAAPVAGAAPPPIEIGIIPTLSTRTILTTYQPLREYLEKALDRPVTLVTAPDYRSFIERTQHRDYPYVLTAAHFARLAQLDAGYVPMARIARELQGVVVVRAGSAFKKIEDLRGQTLATPDNYSVVTMLGRQLLRDHGLHPGKDITLRPMTSFNSAMLAVENGEVAAALTAPTAINQMSEAVRCDLRTVANTSMVPHNFVIASPKVPQADVERMTQLLIEFKDNREYGVPFFERTGFRGFVRATNHELRGLDPYVNELRRQLRSH